MNKLYLFLFVLLLASSLKGQVSVTATAGAANASYPTLKAAFDAINNGTHQGAITIMVNASTTETATARLNASGGTSSYTGIRIFPTDTCIISGNIDGPLIDLNGADSVIIDGRLNGAGTGRSLTVQNRFSTPANNVSTIQLANGAMNNTIRYLNIEGSSRIGNTNKTATIFIDRTYSSGPSSNNIIDNNDIGPAGDSLPACAIKAYADDDYTPFNSGNVISNNLIHDFSALGISTALSNTNYTISGNSMYHTIQHAAKVNGALNFISIYSGGGYTITNNSIGGTEPGAGGSPATYNNLQYAIGGIGVQSSGDPVTVQGNVVTNINIIDTSSQSAIPFTGIYVVAPTLNASENTVGSLTTGGAIKLTYAGTAGPLVECMSFMGNISAIIENNKVGGITINAASAGNSVFQGLFVDNFTTARINHNTIGSAIPGGVQMNVVSGKMDGITLGHYAGGSEYTCSRNTIQHLYNNSSGTTEATINGIYSTLPQEWHNPTVNKITNNLVSHLHLSDTASINGSVKGIYCKMIAGSVRSYMSDSIAGNQVSDLSTTAKGFLTEVAGICHDAPYKTLYILSNTIHGLSSAAANTDTLTDAAVQGISIPMHQLEPAEQISGNISGNRIYDISSTSTAATVVAGINGQRVNSRTFTISKNLIYDLKNKNTSGGMVVGALLTGYGFSGRFIVANNMISLAPENATVYGILNSNTSEEIRYSYNTVAISGKAAGNTRSAAFRRGAGVWTNSYLTNNIFYNTRSGGTGRHYALANDYATPATGWNYSNYNDLYSSNAATVVSWGNTPMSFIDFQAASLRDRCSKTIPAEFKDISHGDLHLLNNYVNQALAGIPVAGITEDFDGEQRHAVPSIGADEIELPYKPPVITASGPLTFCQGGNVILSSSIATGNRWYRNGVLIPGATAQTYQAEQTGFYKTITTDGCITLSSDSLRITVNPMPDTPVITVSGDTLISSAPSGNQWFLYEQPVSGATNQQYIPVQPGRYTVRVNINDCQATSAPVDYGPICSLSLHAAVSPVLCYGGATGAVVVTTEGGTPPFTYTWSNGAATKDLTNVAAGDYNLVVSDAQGCRGTLAVTVPQPTALQVSETHNNITCDKFALGSIDLTVSGGTAPYRYNWSNGATTQDLIWLKAGKYTATVTDSNNCTKTVAVTIAPAPADCNEKTITVYPNPATDILKLKITGYNETMQMVIYDVYGRKRIEQKITVIDPSLTSINVQALTTGPYLLMLTTSDGTVARWFLKIREGQPLY